MSQSLIVKLSLIAHIYVENERNIRGVLNLQSSKAILMLGVALPLDGMQNAI